MLRLQALGLNTVQTLIPWNVHEGVQGDFTWEGAADLAGFIDTAHRLGLMVMLRLGPYICAGIKPDLSPSCAPEPRPQMSVVQNMSPLFPTACDQHMRIHTVCQHPLGKSALHIRLLILTPFSTARRARVRWLPCLPPQPRPHAAALVGPPVPGSGMLARLPPSACAPAWSSHVLFTWHSCTFAVL